MELGCNGPFDKGSFRQFYQADRASTEPCTRHPRTEDPGESTGKIDQQVQLGATHLKLVAQGFMAFDHQLTQAGPMPRFDGPARLASARDFRDDVAAAASEVFRQVRANVFKLNRIEVAPRLNSQVRRTLLALVAPGRIGALGQ